MSQRVSLIEVRGVAHAVIKTTHPIVWWNLFGEHSDKIQAFVREHSGEDSESDLIAAIIMFDDDRLVEVLKKAFEDCPDSVADKNNPESETLALIWRLAFTQDG